MLQQLRVTNFALISDVSIEFGEGFNVLTGETGAGKSLIVEAVNLLRGGRANGDMPRTGCAEAVVEAVIAVPDDLANAAAEILQRSGLPLDLEGGAATQGGGNGRCGELLIRRVVARGGRSRTYINGALATAAVLGELGGMLIDLSGQHEHQGLIVPDKHRAILDGYAGLTPQVERLHGAYQSLADARHELALLQTQQADRIARAEYLEFMCGEVAAAAPQPGELEQLEAERVRLTAVEHLQRGVGAALAAISDGEANAADGLGAAIRELERAARFDDELAELIGLVREAKVLTDEAAAALARYDGRLEANPDRLAEVMARMELLRKLCRKHGGDLAEVMAAHERMTAELAELAGRDGRIAELEARCGALEPQVLAMAREVSSARIAAATKLSRAVHKALAELGMGAAQLLVQRSECALGATGIDRIELMLAANKGLEAKPLSKVASGGELSRIMLALKMCLRRADRVATYVFDEVDTGVGGSTAVAIGRQIRQVSQARQVLCVTHLAQLAAFADHHYLVEKHHGSGKTETTVRRLSAAARRDELARMLGGSATAKAKAHAQELLADAQAA
ncbi:MAG: DNA repair protein RecN [Myxococcales bacterium]|nr:DNA repair protein RecN [Myxococcales bacterium]